MMNQHHNNHSQKTLREREHQLVDDLLRLYRRQGESTETLETLQELRRVRAELKGRETKH